MWKNKILGYKIKEFQSQSRGDSIHITPNSLNCSLRLGQCPRPTPPADQSQNRTENGQWQDCFTNTRQVARLISLWITVQVTEKKSVGVDGTLTPSYHDFQLLGRIAIQSIQCGQLLMSVCQLLTAEPCKTAKLIEMLSAVWTRVPVGPRNHY